jgi:raffinose/stachyose/melibiose transport system permease protein
MNRYRRRTFALELVMVAAALVVAFPVYVLVNLAIRPVSDTSSPLRPTTNPTLDNFSQAWQRGGLGGALFNSVLVTTLSVIVVLAVSSLAAYPLARATAKWSRGMFLLIMLGLLLPFQLAALPLYQTMRDLGLLGSVWALVLFYSGLQVPFTTFLYIGFMRALPREFEEAALIDGAAPLQVFRLVVFPMLKPITYTAAPAPAAADAPVHVHIGTGVAGRGPLPAQPRPVVMGVTPGASRDVTLSPRPRLDARKPRKAAAR